MNNQLQKLQLDLVNYRDAVNRILYATLTTPTDWQQCFREILICVLQLYLDYLFVTKNMSSTDDITSKDDSGRQRLDTKQERTLRKRLKQKLESSDCWRLQFNSKNTFSVLTGLHNLQDYTEKFTLHLPEIYVESLRVEACAKGFSANQDGSALAQLVIGLQHIGRNHIGFVLQALEWAADEDSWESLPAPKIS